MHAKIVLFLNFKRLLTYFATIFKLYLYLQILHQRKNQTDVSNLNQNVDVNLQCTYVFI